MCEICRQNPCDPRCPNARPIHREPSFFDCEDCGERFTVGYEVPSGNGTIKLCDDCAKDWLLNYRIYTEEEYEE